MGKYIGREPGVHLPAVFKIQAKYEWLWYSPKLIKDDTAGRKEVAAHPALDSYRRGHLEISSTELMKVLKVLGHKSSYADTDLIFTCMFHVICASDF